MFQVGREPEFQCKDAEGLGRTGCPCWPGWSGSQAAPLEEMQRYILPLWWD